MMPHLCHMTRCLYFVTQIRRLRSTSLWTILATAILSEWRFLAEVVDPNIGISAFFGDITYVAPKVPTLYTVMTSGEEAVNPAVYGEYSHAYVLDKDQVVDIVVNNLG